MIKIAVIDTAIELNHSCFRDIANISISKKISQNVINENGHGTAVCNIIAHNAGEVEIVVYPIFSDLNKGIEVNELIAALKEIAYDGTYDIVNMSCGVILSENIAELYKICKKLKNNNTILVSAYDNRAMTYPACFDCVIGVDILDSITNKMEYNYVLNSPINIQGYSGLMRLAWSNGKYASFVGSSFITAHITAKISRYLNEKNNKDSVNEYLKAEAKQIIKCKQNDSNSKPVFDIRRAITFPVSKELNVLFRFYSMLKFEIVGCYDFKHSLNVGKTIGEVFNCQDSNISALKVRDIEQLREDKKIDTIIIGHLNQYKIIKLEEDIKEIIKKLIGYNINIYAFNDIIEEFHLKDSYNQIYHTNKYYFPEISMRQYPYKNIGKLWGINSPVLSIIGTKSKQGKYSLMLKIVRKFKKLGYKTEFLSTEPNGWLLGAAGVFSYGYHSDISIENSKGIEIINNMLHDIDKSNPDIIFCAAQSNILPYDNLFLKSISLYSEVFLFATNPDALILNISLEDEMEYICRTIQFAEAATQAKVIAIEVFPYVTNPSNGKLQVQISKEETEEKIVCLQRLYPDKLVTSSCLYGEMDICNQIISCFQS